MTASAVFILDVKGKVIISRNYRGDVPMNCVERFSGHVLEADEADELLGWLEHGTTYVYIKYNNLYIMAVTQRNSNAAMILLFLYRLVEVLKAHYDDSPPYYSVRMPNGDHPRLPETTRDYPRLLDPPARRCRLPRHTPCCLSAVATLSPPPA